MRKRRQVVVKEKQVLSKGTPPCGVNFAQILRQVPVNVTVAFLFGTSDLRRWYETLCQAKHNLYTQRHQLQVIRAKWKNQAAEMESDPQLILWQLFFRLSVAVDAEPLHQNLKLLLDVLPMQRNGALALQIVAARELCTFLDTVWGVESDPPLNQTVHWRVLVLNRMWHVVENPFLARVLVENPVDGAQYGNAQQLLRFVTCCADQLEALGAPIVKYHELTQGEKQNHLERKKEAVRAPTNEVLAASERCGHALKSVIVLATMKEILDTRLKQCHPMSLDKLVDAFFRIIEHCVLLLQTSVIHKDLLTQAGLAYSLVLRLLLRLSIIAVEASNVVTKLLLQTAFPKLNIINLDSCSNTQLRAHIENDVESFGDLSRLAICRGLLNSLADDDLVLSGKEFGLEVEDIEESNLAHSVLNAIFTDVQHFCNQESYSTRLYAFQVLEAFLRRAVLIVQKQKEQVSVASSTRSCDLLADNTLTSLTTAALLNWEHPSKKVNQFMVTVFAHIVNYYVLAGGFQEWSDAMLKRLVELPSTSRAKYGSLALLVGELGAKSVLQASPLLLSSLLLAVGQKDYAAPAAANLFALILDDLNMGNDKTRRKLQPDCETVAAWRQLWLSDVVGMLLSRDANLRSRIAMYVVPLLLKKDPDCVPLLIKRLQEEATKKQTIENADIALWAELEVLKFARKKMAAEKLVNVSVDEIRRGLHHAKEETRSTAFDALCASLKSTSMPTDDELQLVKCYLVINGKEIDPASRTNALIGLKTVLVRIKETLRLASKALAEPSSMCENAATRDEYTTALSFKRWVELFIVVSIYPGALPQRLTLGLEIFLLYVQLFGLESNDKAGGSPQSLLFTKQMLTTLLNILVSAWDSIRSLAFTVLDLYPNDLPGYSTREELRILVDWAVGLSGSPRQRESDAGAMFIRLLFKKCSKAMQQYGLTFQCTPGLPSDTIEARSSNPDVSFVLQLTQVILTRVEALSPAEIRLGKSPLVHGFLLSLHYVLENVAFTECSGSEAADWPRAMKQVFAAVHCSMSASLAVVGDATLGAGDEELSASFAGVVGEVSAVAKTSSSALRVDCRGHLIVENGESGHDGEEDGGNAEQRAVVGSWLAARECGAIFELLMRRVPLPNLNPTSDSVSFFIVEMAQRAGEALLNSLFELKHKGAVATAYMAFEGVCRAFLAHSEHNAVLGALPMQWADDLLERLERSEQHFVLRRSSGFAFSFVAILRAEPRNSAAVILPKVMSTLLRLAGEDTDAAETRDAHKEHHSLWRARVHALNILKLICQDGVLAEDVARYVVDMFELAVRGFDCGSWSVRNSSMMLFAAATQRAIGDKRIADGGTREQVASDDVFSRFQHLRGLLARELTRLLANDSKHCGTLRGAAPPGLYPLLLFLSRLRPGDEDDQHVANASALPCNDEGELADFVPLVIKCASQSSMAIRHMAAKVLASIISDANAASVLSILCAKLPQGMRSVTNHTSDTKGVSHNFVHGVLAQIRHLVAKHLTVRGTRKKCRHTAKDAQFSVFEIVVTKLLPSTKWLWMGKDARSIHAVIRADLVATIDIVLQYYAENASAMLSMLKAGLSMKAFVQQTQAEVGRQLQQRCGSDAAVLLSTQPGMYALDRGLVSIWFSLWALPASVEPLDLIVKQMLVSNVLQIRKKAIKQFGNKLDITKLSTSSVAELQTILIGQFLVETHPKVRSRQLQLLLRCQLHQAIAETQTQRLQLQMELMRTIRISADTEIVAPALELLALMAHHQLHVDDAESPLYQTLSQEIELRSDEKQPFILRQAAASALHYSGLLLLHTKQQGDAYSADLAMTGWMSALRLLQDDEVHVRAVARHAIQNAFDAAGTASSKGLLSDATMLPLAVEYISASFVRKGYGASSLSTMLLRLIDAPSAVAAYAGAKAQDWDDLCRRIFELESSNYFAERDVLAQSITYSLLACAIDDVEPICLLRKQVLTLLADALKMLHLETQCSDKEGGQWLGGIMYYPDVFPPLFGLLAAGVAIVTSTSCVLAIDLETLVCQIHELAEKMYGVFSNNNVTHPLVLRALELLISTDQHMSKQNGAEPVRELLYLTPYWTTLTDINYPSVRLVNGCTR